ncbi:MAG: hypothetical protein KDK78_04250, partial [Chlamydiia bacterium]|nr:hypothetical protein [Chlamydiia bacterium]
MTHLAYRIHSKKSIQSRSLVLELVAAERGPMGWDLGDTLDFKAAAQCELQAVDREIIRSMRAEASVSELLPLLARTGRLFFGAKSIVVNLHKPWQLALKVDGDLEEGFLIEGALCDDKKRVPLADCPLLVMGRPSYALVGPTLRPIEEDIFPQYLQALWPDGSLMVEGNEAQAWLRRLEQEERPDSLLLEMPEGLQRRQERGLEPLPRLRLTDPKGAFAQLAMCYGEVELDAEDPRKRFDCAGQRYDRQFEAERHWEKDLLETAYRKQQVGEAAYYCPLDQVGKSLSFLLELGWDVRDAQGMRVCKSQGKVEAAMRSAKDTLLVQGRVRFDAHEADLKDVLGAFNRRESFVSIGDGMVALLDSGLGEQLLPLIEGGELVQAGVKVPRHAFGLLDGLDSIQPADRASGELCSLLKGDSATVHPTDLQAELRPYQQEGLRWMHARGQAGLSCLLADDMGLGKTVQVLGLISLLPQDAKVLVVMPTSLLFNWQAEAGRFLPGRPVHVHYGSERGEAFAPGITLTSYAILRRDADILRNTTWDLLVLDEAQMIK